MYVIYTAEPQVWHFRKVVSNILRGLRMSPYIAYRLFLKDVKATYSRSGFGMFWDLADPLVFAGIFYFLYLHGFISRAGGALAYPLFVTFGFLLYQTFSESVQLSMKSIDASRSLLNQLKVPPESLILSVAYRILFNSIFRIAIMLALTIFLIEDFSVAGFGKFLLFYPSLIFAGMAFGTLLAPIAAISSDVARFVTIVLMMMRFLTPVMWEIPNQGSLALVNTLNPISNILDNLRMLATLNEFSNPLDIVARLAIFGVILLVGMFVYHVSIPILSK